MVFFFALFFLFFCDSYLGYQKQSLSFSLGVSESRVRNTQQQKTFIKRHLLLIHRARVLLSTRRVGDDVNDDDDVCLLAPQNKPAG